MGASAHHQGKAATLRQTLKLTKSPTECAVQNHGLAIYGDRDTGVRSPAEADGQPWHP